MALVVLVLVVVVALGFLGATLSSRARLEKKSIASFHERMGQLSGVVQHETHLEDLDGEQHAEQPHSLFSEAQVHVRVVGKSSGQPTKGLARSTGTTRERKPNPPVRDSTNASKGNSGRITKPRTNDHANSVNEHRMPPPDQVKEALETSSPDAARLNQPSRPAPARRRSSKVSNSKRGGQVKKMTEVLHFDDSMAKPLSDDSANDLSGYERKVNTKVLAAASVAAVVGLVTIVISLSASHGGAPVSRKSSGALKAPQPSTPVPNRSTKTTVVPAPASATLTLSSANASGAVYFVNSPSITLVINASAASWVEESATPGSVILWEGIIPSGGSKTLTLNSSMWIRTGNVQVLKISANGKPVAFNAPPGVYNFTFRQGVKA